MMGDDLEARRKKTARLQELTADETKILGSITYRRRQKALPEAKFPNKSFKNLNSCWTPISNRASNEQIFIERCELVSHWFDLWTDSQRKRFFRMLLHKSAESQLHFIRDWFDDRVPLRRVDFTSVLPRFLTLYIFSFLDPRSLSRASMVNWHWKFLAEQDCLWMPKCQKYGWFLPYSPSEYEYGAWKRHYVACTMTLDVVLPTKDIASFHEQVIHGNSTYGTRPDGSRLESARKAKRESGTRLTEEQSRLMIEARDPWLVSSGHPDDVNRGTIAYFQGLNPNDPVEPESARLVHNRFGQVDKKKTSLLKPSTSYGMQLSARRDGHHMSQSEELERSEKPKTSLSRSMEIVRFEEERYASIIEMPWEPPQKWVSSSPNLSGGGANYPLPWSKVAAPGDVARMAGLMAGYPGYAHPRVVFVSSRVPAHELLVDAVMFGVIPIVYEFEGTSLETLLFRLDQILRGRHAQSIGVFGHRRTNAELFLAHNRVLDLASLDLPAVRGFVERLAEHTVPADKGGHVDLFSPLGASPEGVELLIQLELLTGLKFTAPTGLLGNYNHVNSEWVPCSEKVHQPTLYFEANKLAVWASAADLVQEAIEATRKSVATYLDRVRVDLTRQITGQIIFDALGQTDILGVRRVGEAVLDGLLTLANSDGRCDPLELLGFHLLERSELGVPADLSTLRSLEASRAARERSDVEEAAALSEEDVAEEIEEEDEAEEEEKEAKEKAKEEEEGEAAEERNKLESTPEKAIADAETAEKTAPSPGLLALQSHRLQLAGRAGARGPMHITPDVLAAHPEQRSAVAQEILASETSYLRTLEIARDWYMTPLRRSVQSNKAILAAHHIQTLFGDLMVLLEISRKLSADLRSRLKQWSTAQCIGDVLLKFCGSLKAYTNFLSNYPIILKTLQRSIETQPKFRAFLAHHDLRPESNMLSLQDFYLAPARHIADLCTLVAWFESRTPDGHPDRRDLRLALDKLRRLHQQVEEQKLRAERDHEILRVQKLILACPQLLEGNRYFILQEDVALLRPPDEDRIDPKFRIYQHIEDCGLFLFNDALLFTRRTSKSFPFTRLKEHTYRFQLSVDLHRITLDDIPDSRYIHNALRIYTARRQWYVGCSSAAAKHRLASSLQAACDAALDNSD